MNPELDKKLCDTYPDIFRDRHAPMTQTCMCWGFECGDGWYHLIDKWCAAVTSYLRNNPEVPPVIMLQVKEKFGTLRLYHSGGDEVTQWLETYAEFLSSATCEECGAPGTINDGGWLKCRCEAHK